MRTVSEIKQQMTDAFLANETLREMYGITDDTTWKDAFSTVSLENILLYIVASAIYTLEVLFDQFKADVDYKVEHAVVASVPWYHKMALAYQHGEALTIDPDTYAFGYATEDEEKRIIKYCAVRDRGSSVQILVSGDSGGSPVALSSDVMVPFTEYMDRVKLAGVVLMCQSYPSDHVRVTANITIDPLVINHHGQRISAPSEYPVEDAIKAYLRNILYGGTLNKTKLVDAIQSVEGVEDVELLTVECRADADQTWQEVQGNNYVGVSGSYVADGLTETLTYQ